MEKKYELVVGGGGLAGVCGAIAGKRLGLSTCIIQDRPVFGGNASSEVRVNIGGAASCNAWARETGIISEIFLEERKRNFENHLSTWSNGILDIVLYEFLRNEGVDIYLNTSIRKAVMKDKETIESVYCVQLGTEKDFIIYGDFFLDATGDGVIGFSAGAEYRIGREGRGEFGETLAPEKPDNGVMGNSLLFLVRDAGKPVKFTPPSWAVKYKKDDITLKAREHNYLPGYWWIEIGWPFDTISDNEEIKDKLIAHILGVWDHMKNAEDHGFGNFVLEWIGMVPGKRESRRLIGEYILNEQDIKGRKIFEDAVAYGGWYIDLHTPGGILAKEEPPEPTHTIDPEEQRKERDRRHTYLYQIPYRCLYSKNIKNLLFAGRNISVSHVALGTTRLMGTCAILGQAAASSVALCKRYNCFPSDIYKKGYYKELQQILLREGCFIPGIKNEDKDDLCLGSEIKASSVKPLKLKGYKGEIKLDIPLGQKLPLCGRIEKIKLKGKIERDTVLKFHLRSCIDIWDFTSENDIISREIHLKKGTEDIVIEINRDFEKGLYWFYFEKNEDVSLRTTDEEIPAGALIINTYKKWRFQEWRKRENLYLEIEPVIYPFEPENIINGISRPESWTNVWIPDIEKGEVQFLEIDLKGEKEFNVVQFIFDGDIDEEYTHIPPFYILPHIPEDFNIYIEKSGGWEKVMDVRGNTKYFVKCKFENAILTRKVRVEFITVNNKEPWVYEIRIYKQG
ncbi:MAG: FAD-dependent oxidoreductase [Candidatus Omnitrophica bacterium]|nr:FAD-dependent oxidoreductase [Candidatus Omnitrophota bacterium]